jgi:hypothetical protein
MSSVSRKLILEQIMLYKKCKRFEALYLLKILGRV